MTQPDAIAMAVRMNADAPPDVSYEVRKSAAPAPGRRSFGGFYVRRCQLLVAADAPLSIGGRRVIDADPGRIAVIQTPSGQLKLAA